MHEPHSRRRREAAISSWIGSALEYYDFFIYGTAAALIFPKIFFPAGNPAAATIASLATFGVAYVARPVGSFILGHLGDTIGRKRVLVITLFGMGSATFLIGVLPTYDQIGIAAPILLLVLRVLQGLAVSGEQSSASSTTLEHAPGQPARVLLQLHPGGHPVRQHPGHAVFMPIAALPDDALLSWGWRIPFLLSAVVMAGRLVDPPHPAREPGLRGGAGAPDVPKAPLKALFRNYTPEVLKVLFAALASVNSTLFGIYAADLRGQHHAGCRAPTCCALQIVVNIIALGAIPAAGHAGRPVRPQAGVRDRHPRRRGD